MGERSKIAWTHHTWNPWWGCVKISEGCAHCYAAALAHRLGYSKGGTRALPLWGVDSERRFFEGDHWAEPLKWNRRAARAGERHRVFCASMADVFEDAAEVPLHDRVDTRAALEDGMAAARLRLWRLIEATPHLDWLLLTKRPQNILRFVPYYWRARLPVNVWVGATVENAKRADERVHALLDIPACVRFVSYEPALERVSFAPWIAPPGSLLRYENGRDPDSGGPVFGLARGLDWIIVGGESGGGARPFDLDWARDQIRATRGTTCAVFVKQVGARAFASHPAARYPETPGVRFKEFGGGIFDLKTKERAGSDWTEWPEDLRLREIPIPRELRDAAGGRDRFLLSEAG